MSRTAVMPQVFLKLDGGAHTADIVQLIVTPDGRRLISAGECTIRVWDAQTRRPLAVLLGHVTGRSEEVFGPGNVIRMALSPADGRSLVVLKEFAPGASEVQVFDIETGNLQSRFLHSGEPADLDFSADGRFIVMAGRGAQVQVYAAREVLKAGFDRLPRPLAERRFLRVPRGAPLDLAVRFVPAPRHRGDPWTLVVALQTDQEGSLHWAEFTPAGGLRRTRRLAAAAATRPQTLSVNDEWAVVGAAEMRRHGRRAMGRLWCLRHDGHAQDCLYTETPPAATVFAPTGRRLLVGLAVPSQYIPGDDTVPVQAYAVNCLGFELRSTYHGHDDEVQGLAFLADDLAVSSGGDSQAIHFWDATGRVGQLQAVIRGVGRTVFDARVNRQQQLLFSTVPERFLPTHGLGRLHTFCLRSFALGSTPLQSLTLPPGDGGRHPRWVVLDATARSQMVPIRFRATATDADLDLPPDLSLFVGSDDEWVLWTRSGYYAASAQGARRMGYQVNRGERQEALFLASDRFKSFDRPDIVRAVVRHGTEERARAAGVSIPPLDVAGLLPPVIELQSAELQPDKAAVRLRFTVQPLVPGAPVTRAWILRNKRYAWTTDLPGPLRQQRFEVELPLGPGSNLFSLRAENASGRAEAIEREFQGPQAVTGVGPVAVDAPGHLFLLSVGVSQFLAAGTAMAERFELKTLKCAHRDAIAVFNALACGVDSAQPLPRPRMRNAAFESVQARLLVNEQATKAAIREALMDLGRAIQARSQAAGAERDVLVLFLAGHGVNEEGERELYFVNFDTDLSREETGLSLVEIGEMLATVPAEVVVLIDACHSGLSGDSIDLGADPDDMARRLQQVSERSMVVLSAARGDEVAHEGGEKGHGIFTAALLATLKSRRYLSADAGGKTASLSLTSLMAGLQAEMPRISARLGKPPQTPVFRQFGDMLPLTIYRR